MTKFNYQKAQFILSAARLAQLPPDEGAEVAFVGRSNAGKSSVLNCLTQNKQLARVSKTPGRTRLLNLFSLDEDARCRLMDLPGYGYAKVPQAMKQDWQKLLDHYLRERTSLRGVVLIMDIRHPLQPFDQHMLDWCQACDMPVHILLNKADKLTRNISNKTLYAVNQEIKKQEKKTSDISLQIFSAVTQQGLDDLQQQVSKWMV